MLTITCLAAVRVFLIERANAMAPRSPVRKSMCCRLSVILCLRPKFNRNDSGYTFNARPMMMETNAAKMKPVNSSIIILLFVINLSPVVLFHNRVEFVFFVNVLERFLKFKVKFISTD